MKSSSLETRVELENLLRLHNTLTRKIEQFQTGPGRQVAIYTCGPSTYLQPHIGNYRTFVYEDILQRYLEYLGCKVTRLMTMTDVEDKAIAEAKKENFSLEELTKRNEAQLFRDFELLRIKVPDYTVRASSVIEQSAKIVLSLIEKGYVYWFLHRGRINAYFDPLKFEGFGKLAHLDMTKWPTRKRRFHIDTYPGTPWNKGDFVVWYGCKKGDLCWSTSIGQGRPAWNIQDAAIVTQHLGFHVDIAAGGIDNLVRHHDYTLAIAESLSGKRFADFWLHGEHLFIDGAKMSKSKGNVLYPDDLRQKGYDGSCVRFFLMQHHYRKRLNFTFEKFAKASKLLEEFKGTIRNLEKASSTSDSKATQLVSSITSSFEESMNRDLDVRSAFNSIYRIVAELDFLRKQGHLGTQHANSALNALKRVDLVLKIIF